MNATKARTAKRATAPASAVERVPAWAPPVLYALATLLLFREAVFTGAGILGIDTMALSYFARDFYTDVVRSGTFPLWNPLILGGLPFVEGMHGDIFYPFSLAFFFLDPLHFWTVKMAGHVFLAGVFTYLWLRRGLDVRRGPAMFGGLVFMMGADLVSLVYPGGDGKLFVSALAPLVFLLAERCMRHRRVSDFAFFALGIALVMFTSHMQLAYFTVWGVSLYMVFRAVQIGRVEGAGKGAALFGAFALVGVLGVAAAAVQFLPPLQYLQEWSQRADRTASETGDAYEYATSFSLHPEEIMSLVVPEFVGDNAQTETRSGNTYWGRNPMKLNHEYAGFIPLLLAPILFLRRRDARAWFFAGLALLSLVYALGANTPLFRLFYLLPGVSLFRAPSLIIFLYGLSVATLGALALQRMLDWAHGSVDEQRAVTKYLLIATAAFGLLALVEFAGGVTSLWRALLYSDLAPPRLQALAANADNIQLGFWLTFLFAAIVTGLWYGLSRKLYGPVLALWLLVGVAALDEYRVGRPFIRATVLLNRFAMDPVMLQPDESIRFLQQRQAAGEVFRVHDLGYALGQATYGSNILAIHGIEQVGGHHGNEMRYYDRLIGRQDQVPNAVRILQTPEGAQVEDFSLLQRTNAEYVVTPGRIQHPMLEEVFVGSRSAVYRLQGVLPRAFLVGNAEVVSDDVALERMLDPAFDVTGTALLATPLASAQSGAGAVQGSVEIAGRGLDEMTLRVQTDAPAVLVVLDNYFPAWHAWVDGEEVQVVRANLAFRALPVPAGEHTVTMRYVPESLHAGVMTSVGLILLLTVVGVGGLVLARRRDGRAAHSVADAATAAD
ncbi:MAG TPA: YfhO family protein [Longimicrobiales bacterium]|nr:YfhO family protein [Longimicrobiales bacterium]